MCKKHPERHGTEACINGMHCMLGADVTVSARPVCGHVDIRAVAGRLRVPDFSTIYYDLLSGQSCSDSGYNSCSTSMLNIESPELLDIHSALSSCRKCGRDT